MPAKSKRHGKTWECGGCMNGEHCGACQCCPDKVTVVVARDTDLSEDNEAIHTYVFAGVVEEAAAITRAKALFCAESPDQDSEESEAMFDEFYTFTVQTVEVL